MPARWAKASLWSRPRSRTWRRRPPKATEDISRRVEAIQADTGGAVAAIEGVSQVIGRISEFQTTIASAVVAVRVDGGHVGAASGRLGGQPHVRLGHLAYRAPAGRSGAQLAGVDDDEGALRACADPPWGGLIGEHATNESLHLALLERAREAAAPGARFLVLTHEIRQMERCLRRTAHPESEEAGR